MSQPLRCLTIASLIAVIFQTCHDSIEKGMEEMKDVNEMVDSIEQEVDTVPTKFLAVSYQECTESKHCIRGFLLGLKR